MSTTIPATATSHSLSLPPWAFTDDEASEVRALKPLAKHGLARLRGKHGQVPCLDAPLPELDAHAHQHPGLCLLAWAAIAPLEGIVHFQLVRAAGRAITALDAIGVPANDRRVVNGCHAIRWLGDADLPARVESYQLPIVLAALDSEITSPQRTNEQVLQALGLFADLIRAGIEAEATGCADKPAAPPTPIEVPAEATPPPAPPSPATTTDTAAEAETTTVPSDPPGDPASPPLGPLPSRPLAAIRARAQRLDTGSPRVLHPPELRLALRTIAEEGDLLERAIVVVTLLVGPAARKLRPWRVAVSPEAVDLASAPAWLVLEPLSIHLVNRINDELPDAPTGSDLVASAGLALPLHPDLYGMQDLIAWATPRAGGPLVTRTELGKVSKLLRRIRDRCDLPLTRRRLSEVMEQVIRTGAGDDIPLAYLSAAPKGPRIMSRSHYRGYSLEQLQRIWLDSLMALQRLLGQPIDDLRSRVRAAPSGRVGSMLSPEYPATCKWTARLRAPIATPLRGQPIPVRLAAWHNDYIVYVVQLLQWATGIRPTAGGVLSAWPDDAGYLVVADKFQKDLRRLPLCDTAKEQWQEFARHRQRLVRRLRLVNPPHWFTLHIDEKGNLIALPLTPDGLHARSASPFAENAHRHALSTELARVRWTGDRIAQWLGQASIGHEPGARYAGHDPRWTPEELADIDHHLIVLGWKVVKGLGHG